MSYQNLTFADAHSLIQGVELPKSIILSLEKRGKRKVNFRYNHEEQTLEVKCTHCQQWFGIYLLDTNNTWIDINNGVYWVTRRERANDFYFANQCGTCYASKKSTESDIMQKSDNIIDKTDENEEDVYYPWSKFNGGVQQTIGLTKENDRYLKIYSAIKNQKKNAIINKILDRFREENPNSFE